MTELSTRRFYRGGGELRVAQSRRRGPSPRQREVARLTYEGMSYKEIAADLGIAEKTVKIHMAQLSERVDGHGKPQVKAVRWWAERLMEERDAIQRN